MNLLKGLALFASLLLVSSSAFAKGKQVDLSAFKGNYSGTFVAVEGTSSVSGNITVAFTPAKNGKTATLSYQGSFVSGMSVFPVSTVITFNTKGSTSSVTNVLLGLGSGALLPGTGSVHFGKRNFNFSATSIIAGAPYVLSGTGTVKDIGKKRNLTLNFLLNLGTDVVSFNNTLTAKAPKK